MRSKLREESASEDKWTAAQCLAYYGECDSLVVQELITHLLNTDDLMRHEQAATLLATLSESSVRFFYLPSTYAFFFIYYLITLLP